MSFSSLVQLEEKKLATLRHLSGRGNFSIGLQSLLDTIVSLSSFVIGSQLSQPMTSILKLERKRYERKMKHSSPYQLISVSSKQYLSYLKQFHLLTKQVLVDFFPVDTQQTKMVSPHLLFCHSDEVCVEPTTSFASCMSQSSVFHTSQSHPAKSQNSSPLHMTLDSICDSMIKRYHNRLHSFGLNMIADMLHYSSSTLETSPICTKNDTILTDASPASILLRFDAQYSPELLQSQQISSLLPNHLAHFSIMFENVAQEFSRVISGVLT